MADVKLREIQMDQDDSSWLTTRIEDPNAMATVCLRACRHSADIDHPNELKFNKFSRYIHQLVGFVSTSNLANKGNHTFAVTFGSRIMYVTMADNAKAQPPPPK
jgi:hypothetical protein